MIQNPILKGFCPDPSIIRAEDDYYIATSTFEWWPGVRISHSKDLVHWEEIPSPLRRLSQLNMLGDPTSGGIWAPCLSYDGRRFYLVYTDVKTKKGRFYNTHNYLVYTEDIYGEWSEPIYLNSIGFDPSLFHDTDGKKYLINMVNGFKGILVQEIDPETFAFKGERKKVYEGSGIGCTEGPHMYHIGDWYYLIVAEGGTGYDHCVTMARSKSVFGPFETMPDNPVLTSNVNDLTTLQKCGHADIVETKNGEWYMVHLCSRPLNGKKWCTLGRETAIQKVYWDKDGWLRLCNNTKYPDTYVLEPGETDTDCCNKTVNASDAYELPLKDMDVYDDFLEDKISNIYSSPRLPYEDFISLTAREGYLRIKGRESLNSLHHVSLLATRQRSFNVEVETKMDFKPSCEEQMAGLTYFYDAMNYYLFAKTVDDKGKSRLVLLKSDSGVITDETEPVLLSDAGEVKLRLEVSGDGAFVQFSYCMADGNLAGRSDVNQENKYINVGNLLSTEILTDEHCRGFTGAHFGMYSHDMAGLGSYADFDCFSVKNI